MHYEVDQETERQTLVNQLSQSLDEVNDELNPWEKISNIVITPEWTIENSLLTQAMKLKRNAIYSKYQSEIKGIYKDRLNDQIVCFSH